LRWRIDGVADAVGRPALSIAAIHGVLLMAEPTPLAGPLRVASNVPSVRSKIRYWSPKEHTTLPL
jgi:hypothetical protein